MRSILDGHIVLARELGQAGHYPAIDITASISRVFTRVVTAEHRAAAQRLRALAAKHNEIRFLVQVGEYKPGTDATADAAIQRWPAIEALLRQAPEDSSTFSDTLQQLLEAIA